MATISNTPRPGYVWDSTDNVWYPIGVGGHGHPDYITQATAISPTTVDAKGDLLVGSAADTISRLAVGADGSSIVADSSTSTGLRYQGNYAAGKNKFLNGDFSIWQRGTSTTLSAGFAYTADRYYAGGNGTVSQQTFTAGTAPVAGYEGKYFARWNLTSNSQNYEFMQRIESARTFAGQTATFSFWAKLNSGTASFNVVAYQSFGTGGSPSSLVNVIPSTAISLTSSWQRFTYTVAVPSVAGKTFGTNNDDYLYLSIQSTSTNTGAFDTWGWQAEAGNTATAFATATGTIQGELAACQRYYEKSYEQATAPGTASQEKGIISAVGGNAINGGMVYGLKYAVTKRSTPTLTFYSYTGASGKLSDGGGTDLAANSAFTNSTYNGTSGTRIYNSSGGTISAAYGGYEVHFTADAEL